jgi:preprotein translocase subunit SecE
LSGSPAFPAAGGGRWSSLCRAGGRSRTGRARHDPFATRGAGRHRGKVGLRDQTADAARPAPGAAVSPAAAQRLGSIGGTSVSSASRTVPLIAGRRRLMSKGPPGAGAKAERRECGSAGDPGWRREAGLKPPRRSRISQGTRREEAPMASRTNPLQFLQQVRAEVAKIVWPTRREVGLTTVMVFIMATLTAIFFFLVDLLIRTGLTFVLGIAG